MRAPRILLVTAFGPFPGAPRNPSAAVAALVARRPAPPGWRVVARVVPTTWAALGAEWPDLLAEVAPDAVLMLGLAGRARALRVEARARPRATTLRPDAARRLSPSPRAFAGPERRAAAPVARLVAAARRRAPARALIDAGDYLCNAAYGLVLGWAADGAPRRGRAAPVAFLHLPRPAAPGRPSRRPRRAPRRPALAAIAAAARAAAGVLATADRRARPR